MTLSAFVTRGPLHDSRELARFNELINAAHRDRVLRWQCEPIAQVVGPDVMVYCPMNRGGPPGKRYRHVTGWLSEFERDLRDCYFLAM
jgi:hypothetical protein